MSKRRVEVYVDLDGPLTNLNKHGALVLGYDYPTSGVLTWDWLSQVSKDPLPLFLHDLATKVDMSQLPRQEWADQLIHTVQLVDPNYHFLTGCLEHPAPWSQKAAWIERHYGSRMLGRTIMCGKQKHLLAAPNRVLIEDNPEVCEAWREHGGLAVRLVETVEEDKELRQHWMQEFFKSFAATVEQARNAL